MRLPALQVGLLSAGIALSIQLPVNTAIQPIVETVGPYNIGNLQIHNAVVSQIEVKEASQVLAATTEIVAETATPAPVQVIVTVQKGDNLSKIAKENQVTVQRLYDANTFIIDPNVINPGNIIRIPLIEEAIANRLMPIAPPKPVFKAVPKVIKPAATNATAVTDGSVWDALARCESVGNWAINTGNGYSGGLQFLPSTWRAVGGQGLPHENSRVEQILRGQILQARSGWGQWPACTKKLGLR